VKLDEVVFFSDTTKLVFILPSSFSQILLIITVCTNDVEHRVLLILILY